MLTCFYTLIKQVIVIITIYLNIGRYYIIYYITGDINSMKCHNIYTRTIIKISCLQCNLKYSKEIISLILFGIYNEETFLNSFSQRKYDMLQEVMSCLVYTQFESSNMISEVKKIDKYRKTSMDNLKDRIHSLKTLIKKNDIELDVLQKEVSILETELDEIRKNVHERTNDSLDTVENKMNIYLDKFEAYHNTN